MQKLPRLENRAPGIPTTTVTNEIAETVNAMQATIVTGQDDEARGGVAEEHEIGQYQGEAHIMVVNGVDGWEFPFLHPIP